MLSAATSDRGSRTRLIRHAIVLLLLLTTVYGAASLDLLDLPTDELAQRSAAETAGLEDLTMRGESWLDGQGRLVNKRQDATSLSAFQSLIAGLQENAKKEEEARAKLAKLREMGVLDENNEVIKLPPETVALMKEIG